MTTHTPGLLSADSISDTKVYNLEGDKLGEIEELMINLSNGRVEYAVLEFHHGFLNMGEKLFAIPFQALQFDTQDEKIILNVSKDKLKNAPGFDKDNWPNFADQSFNTQVYSYYGYTYGEFDDRIAA